MPIIGYSVKLGLRGKSSVSSPPPPPLLVYSLSVYGSLIDLNYIYIYYLSSSYNSDTNEENMVSEYYFQSGKQLIEMILNDNKLHWNDT